MAHDTAHETESHDHHPGPRQYVIIGLILAVLTGAEFGVFYLEWIDPAVMTFTLLGLSLAKFILVVGYFMHLKFDDKRFSYLFVFPMFVMISIAVVLMALFQSLTR